MNHGSLFSGIGGFDLAAERMGWTNVFHCEISEFPRKILHHYWPNAISYENICTTDFSIHRGNIDIISGGFPCQPFSTAGQRKGTDDSRYLWPEMLRVIREVRPRWVVGENVHGLVSWDGGLVLDTVCADLENEGYEILPIVLPAASVNAPHKRNRIFFIAKNAMRDGRLQFQSQEEGTEVREQRNIGTGSNDRVHQQENAGVTANANDTRTWVSLRFDGFGEAVDQGREGQSQSKHRKNGNNGDASNSEHEGLEGQHWEREGRSEHRGHERIFTRAEDQFAPSYTNGIGLRYQSDRFRESRFASENGKTNYWQDFPTQSPICGGDDELPTLLHNITFSKWRNESIKGYGNAVVPELIMMLFKTIEEYETNTRTS